MIDLNETVTPPRPGLYICCRTSSGNPSIPEAFKVLVVETDTRCCDDPKKIPANYGTDGDWYTIGTNHRVEDGMIKRDIGTRYEWAVELTDIMEFVDRYGECIVGRDDRGFCTIEIYDDYRE